MTIHEPGHPCYGWRCERPGCTDGHGAGYPSQSAARRAEKKHTATHPTAKASER